MSSQVEERNDVVLKFQSDKAIGSKWRSDGEIAITNQAYLLDRRDREVFHFRTEVSKMNQELTAASQAFAQLGGSESFQQEMGHEHVAGQRRAHQDQARDH